MRAGCFPVGALGWLRGALAALVLAAALTALYGQQSAPQEREMVSHLAKTLTKTQMMRTIELLQKYRLECGYNIGPNHVLGALAVELEGIL